MTMSTPTDTTVGRRTRADAAPASASTWFEAPSSFGALRLQIDGAAAAGRAAEAAVVLQRSAALLDAFDDWSGLDADWRWIEPPELALSASTHVWVDWTPIEAGTDASGDPPISARLELPWALLRRLPAPPDALQPQLHWPAVPTALVISRPKVGEADLSALEPGGAVLLPESLGRSWQGVLRALDEPAEAGVPLALPSPWTPRVLAQAAAPAGTGEPAVPPADAGGSIACEVRLATRRALAADQLAGWHADEAIEVGQHASLWHWPAAGEPAIYLASGRLMSWADGWALALEAVCGVGRESSAAKV
jgi:hypothetical protein